MRYAKFLRKARTAYLTMLMTNSETMKAATAESGITRSSLARMLRDLGLGHFLKVEQRKARAAEAITEQENNDGAKAD